MIDCVCVCVRVCVLFKVSLGFRIRPRPIFFLCFSRSLCVEEYGCVKVFG